MANSHALEKKFSRDRKRNRKYTAEHITCYVLGKGEIVRPVKRGKVRAHASVWRHIDVANTCPVQGRILDISKFRYVEQVPLEPESNRGPR